MCALISPPLSIKSIFSRHFPLQHRHGNVVWLLHLARGAATCFRQNKLISGRLRAKLLIVSMLLVVRVEDPPGAAGTTTHTHTHIAQLLVKPVPGRQSGGIWAADCDPYRRGKLWFVHHPSGFSAKVEHVKRTCGKIQPKCPKQRTGGKDEGIQLRGKCGSSRVRMQQKRLSL